MTIINTGSDVPGKAGVARMPKQDISTLADGTKAGYIGEDTGEVETYDPPEPGSSNVLPDLATAKARVQAAQIELDRAQRSLDEVESAHADAKDKAASTKASGEVPPAWETEPAKKKEAAPATPPA